MAANAKGGVRPGAGKGGSDAALADAREAVATFKTVLDNIDKAINAKQATADIKILLLDAERDKAMANMHVKAAGTHKSKELNALKEELSLLNQRCSSLHVTWDTKAMSGGEMIAHGNKVLDESDQSLNRTLKTLHQTTEVATSSCMKLSAQTDQLLRIDDTVVEVATLVADSDKIIKRMGRKM